MYIDIYIYLYIYVYIYTYIPTPPSFMVNMVMVRVCTLFKEAPTHALDPLGAQLGLSPERI